MTCEIADLEDRAAGRIGMNDLRAGSDEERAAAQAVEKLGRHLRLRTDQAANERRTADMRHDQPHEPLLPVVYGKTSNVRSSTFHDRRSGCAAWRCHRSRA